METAARGAFEKLGDTRLELESFAWHNPDGRFVPVSRLNQLRRDLAAGAGGRRCDGGAAERVERVARARASVRRLPAADAERAAFRWSIKVDRIGFLDAFEAADWAGVDEVDRRHRPRPPDAAGGAAGRAGRA